MVYYIYMKRTTLVFGVLFSTLLIFLMGAPLFAEGTGEILYASSFSEEIPPASKTTPEEKKNPPKKEAKPQGTKVSEKTLVMYTPDEENITAEETQKPQELQDKSQQEFQPKSISFGLTGDLYIEDQNFALYAAPFFQYYKDNLKLRFEIPANMYFRQNNEWGFAFDYRGWQFFTDPSFWPIYQGVLHKIDTIAYALRIQDAEIFSLDFSRRERKGLSAGGFIAPALDDPRYRMALQGAFYVNTTFFSAEAYTPNMEDLTVAGARLGFHSSSRHPVETGISVAYGSDLQSSQNTLGLLALGVDQYIPLFTTTKTKTGLLLETGIIAPIEEGTLDWKAIAQISSGFFRSLDSFYLSGGITVNSDRFSSNHYVSYSRSIYRGFFNQYYRDNQSAIHSMYANETSSGVYENGPYMLQYETDNRIKFGKEQELRIVYALNFSQDPVAKNWDYNFDRFTALWTLNDPLAYKKWHGSAGISMENLGSLIKGDQSFLEFTKMKHTYLHGSIRYGITDFLFIQGAINIGKDPVSASLGVTLRF